MKILLKLNLIIIIFLNKVYWNCTFGICNVNETLTTDNNDISIYIIDIIIYLLWFIWLIWIVWLIKWGFQILTAGWDEEKFKNGKKTILFWLLGIFVILIAWAIVNWVINWLKNIG
jgi:small-conductance mechanosensitive channel